MDLERRRLNQVEGVNSAQIAVIQNQLSAGKHL